MNIELPPPCAPGLHVPVIMHRTRKGGDDSKIRNVCGLCGRQIENADEDSPYWVTQEQADAYAAEKRDEIARDDRENSTQGAGRCPPRG